MARGFLLLVPAMAITVVSVCAAQAPQKSNRVIEAVKVSAPPIIDGVLDDACWEKLPTAAPFYDNDTAALVKDQTTVCVGYDDANFYFAFECMESQPAKIVARETKRGASLYSDDSVMVFINPYGTKSGEDESMLMVNALGTQFMRFAEGRANKQEWEGEWLSAAKIGKDRWTVEVAVPWKILKHKKSGGKPVDMDLNFGRRQIWSGVYSCWSYTTIQGKAEFTGEWHGVAIPDANDEPPLSTMWYAYSGLERDRLLGKLGADLRYRIDPEQTALLTLNPDFGNIERSVTSIDFSYASKLSAETRPFFLEGRAFLLELGVNAFTSVQIPDIDVGAKYFGRPARNLSAGVLATHSLDSERTDTAFSLTKRFSQYETLSIGAVTRNEPGIENSVLSAGGSLKRGSFSFAGQYLASNDRTGAGDAGYLVGMWSSGPWYSYAQSYFTSPGYLPRDGYVSFNDERGFQGLVMYSRPWRSGPFRDFSCTVFGLKSFRYDDSFFRDSAEVDIEATTRNQMSFFGSISAGRFEDNRDHVVRIGAGYPANDSNRYVSLQGAFGRQSSLDYRSVNAYWYWRFTPRLKLGGDSEIVHIGGSSSQHTATLSYDLSKDQAIGGRMVMRDGVANWYLSYRKSGYKGTEYYVILGDPNAEKFETRLVLKVVGVL